MASFIRAATSLACVLHVAVAFPATLVPRQVVQELPHTVRQMIGNAPDEQVRRQLAQWKAESDSFSIRNNATKRVTPPPAPMPLAGKVLFHVSDDEAIYDTTTFSYGDGSLDPVPFIAASLGDNGGPEAAVDVYNANSSTVVWSASGQGYISASAENITASALCAVGADAAQCTVTATVTSTGFKLWETVIRNVGATAIGVSPDGQVVSVAVTYALPPYPAQTGFHGQMYEWDAATGGLLGVWNADNTTFGDSNIRAFISTTNLFAAVVSGTKEVAVAVIKRSTGTLLWQDKFDFSTSTLCFSRDGAVMGYGFETFDLFHVSKDGASYDQVASLNGPAPGAAFAAACSVQTIQADELIRAHPRSSEVIGGHQRSSEPAGEASHTLAIGWTALTYTQVTVMLHDVKAPMTPLWTYPYPSDAGSTVQNLPSVMAASEDGKHFVVATWGGSAGVSPQIAVFGVQAAEPLFTMVTSGSMVTADIKSMDDGRVYAVAAGKHVHCNLFGSGGDMYSIQAK